MTAVGRIMKREEPGPAREDAAATREATMPKDGDGEGWPARGEREPDG